ncbi:VanZ family protein [Actinoplanes sp. NPDC048967]|uniref:VanZ family protein n=1 Tax=Actinoplanes sp. NPDC048967 TaxID=3155269 RepID=UPI0033FA17C7
MPFHQLDVPALPILLPLGGLLMIVSWVWLHRRGRLGARRLATAWIAGWYAVAVVGATLLPLHLAWGPGAGPPELYRIILVPLITMRVDDFLLNIVMTLPLAALLYLVAGLRERRRVVLTGFLVSLVIEITQAVICLAWHGNRWADVNDLTANTLGAWLGFGIFWRALRSARVRELVRGWSLGQAEPAAPPVHRPATRS